MPKYDHLYGLDMRSMNRNRQLKLKFNLIKNRKSINNLYNCSYNLHKLTNGITE